MSTDSVVQILEGRDGIYTDWHPPFMAFLWRFMDRATPGPLGMLILQTSLIWLGTFLVARNWFLSDQTAYLALPASLIVFYPPIFTITGAIWKDILMWAFIVMAIGIAGAMRSSAKRGPWPRYAGLALIAIFLFLAMLVRHNAIFAAIPLMVLGIAGALPEGQRHRVVIAGLTSSAVCAVLVSGVSLVNRKLSDYATNPWASVAIFDVTGTIYRTPQVQIQQALYQRIPSRIRGDGTLTRLLETYNSHRWLATFQVPSAALVFPPHVDNALVLQRLTIGFELNEEEKKALFQLWLDCLFHHTHAWLRHRTSVFIHIMGLDGRDLWFPVFMDPNGGNEQVSQYYGQHPPLNHFQLALKWRFQALSKRLFYRPWIYLLLTVAIITLCLAFRNQARTDVLLIAFSGLAYECALFFIGPGSDFRFSHYMIYTSTLATLLLIRTIRHVSTDAVAAAILQFAPVGGPRQENS